jgi:histidine ammonia-lyase
MNPLVLDGEHLTIEGLTEVARGRSVEIAPEALERVERSSALLARIAEAGTPKVYGLNTGVGINKDQPVTAEHYIEYNLNMLRVHCVGVPPYASEERTRAVMAAKLNGLLGGRVGMKPELVLLYRDFLNARIHPLIPLRGSVGEADIVNLSHLGLALLGEGKVIYRGETVPAGEAIAAAGLRPGTLGPRDGLALVSSNALGAALGALILDEAEALVETADLAYALTMEGFKGNVSPLDRETFRLRPYPGALRSMEHARELLAGSDLWETDAELQDPLSIRCSVHVHGAVRESLEHARRMLLIQLNSTDENPTILFEEGRVIPCGNFEPLSWVLPFEMLGVALSHLSRTSTHRILRLSSPRFTGLPRFLNPREGICHAFGVIQKTFTSLDGEIRHLSNPISADYCALSEDQEDRGCNTPYVMLKLEKILNNLGYILGIEFLHAAQAVDLRGSLRLGRGTEAAYRRFREAIPFMDTDRDLSGDILEARRLVAGRILTDAAEEAVVPGGR